MSGRVQAMSATTRSPGPPSPGASLSSRSAPQPAGGATKRPRASSEAVESVESVGPLSSGAVEQMYLDDPGSVHVATVQVWGIEKVQGRDVFSIVLSDGVHFQRGELSGSSLNAKVLDGSLAADCIVVLRQYRTCTLNRSCQMIVMVTDLEVIAPAQAEHIGNPIDIQTAPCALNWVLAKKIVEKTLHTAEDLTTLIDAGADVNQPVTINQSGVVRGRMPPLQLAVQFPASDPDVIRWLVKAGASLHTEVSNHPAFRFLSRSCEPSKVDVLFLGAAGADAECLEVLLGTGMESRLHDDAVLQRFVGKHVDEHALQCDVYQDVRDDSDFEYGSDDDENHRVDYGLEMRVEELARDRFENMMTSARKTISDTFEQRALVQAYRRLALCSGGCSTRLGVESPIGQTNTDVLEHLLTAHLLIDKPRMPGAKNGILSHLYVKTNILPRQARDKHRENSKKMPFFAGAPVSSAVLLRVAEQTWPRVATEAADTDTSAV
jgi:hypothetical protein